MAMVSVNWQPTGGLTTVWFKPIGLVQRSAATWRRAALNQGELSQCFKHNDSTKKIVAALLLLLLLLCVIACVS